MRILQGGAPKLETCRGSQHAGQQGEPGEKGVCHLHTLLPAHARAPLPLHAVAWKYRCCVQVTNTSLRGLLHVGAPAGTCQPVSQLLCRLTGS